MMIADVGRIPDSRIVARGRAEVERVAQPDSDARAVLYEDLGRGPRRCIVELYGVELRARRRFTGVTYFRARHVEATHTG